MKKQLLFIASIVLSSQTLAAANVNYLNVDGDVLYFSTSENKAVSSPSCVALATNNRWAISLTSHQGQGIYAMLLTAITNNIAVDVSTAGDCNDANGIERPQSVALSQ